MTGKCFKVTVMQVLLDTCAVIWSVGNPEQLSPAARDMLTLDETEAWISPISCAEVACAAERGRITLDRHWRLWFRYYVDLNKWRQKDINLDVMEESYSLPGTFHQDPADRIIVATARIMCCPIITSDRKMLDYPHVQTIW